MSAAPEVKSRGMKFAEEQLLKHGGHKVMPTGILPYLPTLMLTLHDSLSIITF